MSKVRLGIEVKILNMRTPRTHYRSWILLNVLNCWHAWK